MLIILNANLFIFIFAIDFYLLVFLVILI